MVENSSKSHIESTRLDGLHALCQITTPVGMLGYGFEEEHLIKSLDKMTSTSTPTAIILDSGSTDSGPMKLATGHMSIPKSSYKRDLSKLIRAIVKYRVPLLISSAGGDGTNAHVDEVSAIAKEIIEDHKSEKLKLLTLHSDISEDMVLERMMVGKVAGCGRIVPELTTDNVKVSPTIASQMGPEPIFDAMMAHPDFDILIAGRAYDPAPYIAFCAFHALHESSQSFGSLGPGVLGGFAQMGKILECGGLCATPKSRGAEAVIYENGTFDIAATDPSARCTPLSVAAHTLYEKTRPDILTGPGGDLDLSKTTYQQLEDKISVRARGAIFRLTKNEGRKYTVKLEGAKLSGYRTIFMGSFIDPILTSQIESFLATGTKYVASQNLGHDGKWELQYHITGLEKDRAPGKIFIVGEALAETQELANSIVSTARIYCAHAPYKGQKATSGNFAMGIGGKMEIPLGQCAEFSVYHLMELEDGEERGKPVGAIGKPLFTWKMAAVGSGDHKGRREAGAIKEPTRALNEIPLALSSEKHGHLALKSSLGDIAKVVRSKNSGPFEVTFDVMFDDSRVYQAVKKSSLLGPAAVASLLGHSVEDIVWSGFFDQALAFKATFPRTRKGVISCSGGYMEDDIHGSQLYLPLMNMELGAALVETLRNL